MTVNPSCLFSGRETQLIPHVYFLKGGTGQLLEVSSKIVRGTSPKDLGLFALVAPVWLHEVSIQANSNSERN